MSSSDIRVNPEDNDASEDVEKQSYQSDDLQKQHDEKWINSKFRLLFEKLFLIIKTL